MKRTAGTEPDTPGRPLRFAGKALVPLCLLLVPASLPARTLRLHSPGGHLRVELQPAASGLLYRVKRDGRPVLLSSRLQLEPAGRRLRLVRVTRSRRRSSWTPVYGQWNRIPDRFDELTLELRGARSAGLRLRVCFRAYDEGIAFRTTLRRPGRFTLSSEGTEFHFPPGAAAYEEHGTEGVYHRTPVASIHPGCQWPLTVDYGNGLYASLMEAANIDYSQVLLSPVKGRPGVLQTALTAPVTAAGSLSTPWRVLLVGTRPAELANHAYLLLDLNAPNRIADPGWIRPGKAIREVTLSTRGGLACVDFARRHGLQYVEYDAGWYGNEYDARQDATTVTPDPARTAHVPHWGGLDLPRVIRYASRRGVGVFLYVNRRQLERQLDRLLPLYERWGVKGVKFGFVRVRTPAERRWLHRAVRRAAAHHLMVDIHDAYRPTGYSRTYPNLLTQEGVRGNEHMPTARHNATLPFTRFLAGAADYTICYYSPRIQTTRAHQLALAVVFYSPLQFLFWYDQPSAYHGEPEIRFFHDVPTVWDDTKVLAGRIGEFVVTARRKRRQWFLGAITNETARELEVPLPFLAPGTRYRAEIYRDGATPESVVMETRIVDAGRRLRLRLAANGGEAVRLVPLRRAPGGDRAPWRPRASRRIRAGR